jgi:hypothetical protein
MILNLGSVNFICRELYGLSHLMTPNRKNFASLSVMQIEERVTEVGMRVGLGADLNLIGYKNTIGRDSRARGRHNKSVSLALTALCIKRACNCILALIKSPRRRRE